MLKLFSYSQFRREFSLISAIAIPMMIAQIAHIGTGFVDTIMAGRVSQDDLAAVGLGSSIFMTVFVTLLGMPSALNPILSQSFGAKQLDILRQEIQQGIILCTIIGIIGSIIVYLIAMPLQEFLHWQEYGINTTRLYLYGIALGLPAVIIGRALQAYAAALNNTKAIMWIGMIGLALNIPLNYIFIHGFGKIPALGGAGCGFASAIIFWFNTIALWVYLNHSAYFKPFEIKKNWNFLKFNHFAEILKLGLPISFSFFVEVSLFSFITILIANSGTEFVATQQIALTITGCLYIIPQTISVATGTRVGQSIGERNKQNAYKIAWIGIIGGSIIAALLGLLLAIFRLPLIHLFTSEKAVIIIGANVLLFAAFYQLVDSAQTIASGALRGYKVTTIPMMIHMFSFWLLGLGLGYFLAFNFNLKLYGFWIALSISLTFAAFALSGYLIYIGKRI